MYTFSLAHRIETTSLSLVLVLLSILTVSFYKGGKTNKDELAMQIEADYRSALSLADRESFHGYCNLATAYQLIKKGVYSDSPDYAGNGNAWFSHYETLVKNTSDYTTSGGYHVYIYEGADCLQKLIKERGNKLYNIVYSLGTGGSSGSNHVMLISALIDGEVFFADSFGYTYDDYYPEGSALRMPLDDFIDAYKSMNGDPHGCVWFSEEKQETKAPDETSPEQTSRDDSRSYLYVPTLYQTLRNCPVYASMDDVVPVRTIEADKPVTITEIDGAYGLLPTGEYVVLDNVWFYPKPVIISIDCVDEQPVGDPIVWITAVDGGFGGLTVSYSIADGNGKVVRSIKNGTKTVSYAPAESGQYTLSVFITDKNGISIAQTSEPVQWEPGTQHPVGDANLDWSVTAVDARDILRHAASLEAISDPLAVGLSDIDEDGRISARDARLALRIAAKLSQD